VFAPEQSSQLCSHNMMQIRANCPPEPNAKLGNAAPLQTF